MINLPHIGLYGDLSACEDGMIDALNRNFSLLDAIVQLKVLDFVTELPEDPEKGDVYILNTPLDPLTDKNLMIFNGVNWVQIIPQDGFIAYIDSQESFYYYNDGEWIKDLTDLSEIKLKLGRATSTGVIDGLNLSTASGDDTKFDIAAGIYEIVDLSDVDNPVVKTIQYAGSTGNAVTNLATQDVTYISLDEDGVIHQSINYPTPNERRQYAFVGRLNHTNRTSISFADTFPDFKLSPVASFYDLVDALAPFKMDQGLKTTPNGANLSFDVSAGKVFFRSDNYATDKNNPHTKTFNDQVLAPFRKMTQTSTVDAADVTVLEPSYYDVAGVRTLIAGGPSQSTIQRIYKYKSGAIRVAYGQNVYTNMSAAREAVNFDSFIENPTINQTAVLIALVIITKGCTDLSDSSQCVILPASRFGSVSGGGGGTGSGVMVVSDLTARNNIPEGTRTDGMLVQVISTDTIYKLIGLPAGATTTDANWDHVITGKAAQVITNKDIDGGAASNTSRWTAPKGTKAELDALTRKEGTILFATDELKLYYDNGTALVPLGTQIGTGIVISHTFKANGNYKAGNGIDGIFVLPWNAKISNVILANEISGTSGTTEIDLKIKPQGSGSFTSIFSTTPKLASSSGSNAWVGIGDTVTGGTPAVLTDENRVYNQKDGFRMDILGIQGGIPAEMAITIYFEKV